MWVLQVKRQSGLLRKSMHFEPGPSLSGYYILVWCIFRVQSVRTKEEKEVLEHFAGVVSA